MGARGVAYGGDAAEPLAEAEGAEGEMPLGVGGGMEGKVEGRGLHVGGVARRGQHLTGEDETQLVAVVQTAVAVAHQGLPQRVQRGRWRER